MHHNSGGHRIAFFFSARRWRNDPHNREPSKCDAMGYFPITNLPANTVSYVRKAIEERREQRIFSIFGWKETPE